MTAAVAPEFRAGHVEDAPVTPPFHGVFGAVGFGNQRKELFLVIVHVPEPSLGGFLVMLTVDLPMLLDAEVVLEVEQKIIGRHLTTGEEIFRHPIIVILDDIVIGDLTMRENVDEKFTIGLEPFGNALEQDLVVFHVLEHFDGDTAIENGFADPLEGDHVRGDDLDVVKSAFFGFGQDVFALGAGVRYRGDFRVGEMTCHPEGEGAPAATEFEDALAVGEFGAFAGDLQHP